MNLTQKTSGPIVILQVGSRVLLLLFHRTQFFSKKLLTDRYLSVHVTFLLATEGTSQFVVKDRFLVLLTHWPNLAFSAAEILSPSIDWRIMMQFLKSFGLKKHEPTLKAFNKTKVVFESGNPSLICFCAHQCNSLYKHCLEEERSKKQKSTFCNHCEFSSF